MTATTINRDFYAGAFTALIGAVAIVEGGSYRIGSLVQMGPGFFPLALGVILVFCGLLLVLGAKSQRADPDHTPMQRFDLRGIACILAGITAFIVLGQLTGMAVAIFSAVFISSAGDRSATLKSSLILALVVTLFGALLFHFALNLPMPLFQWGSP